MNWVDPLTHETELTTVRLPLTQELREYPVSCTERHRLFPCLAGLVAGGGLWILACATWNGMFFVLVLLSWSSRQC